MEVVLFTNTGDGCLGELPTSFLGVSAFSNQKGWSFSLSTHLPEPYSSFLSFFIQNPCSVVPCGFRKETFAIASSDWYCIFFFFFVFLLFWASPSRRFEVVNSGGLESDLCKFNWIVRVCALALFLTLHPF